MPNAQHTPASDETKPASLAVRKDEAGRVVVSIGGDWIARTGLPQITKVERAVVSADGAIKAMEFDTAGLGRWNSGLITFVLKCRELCVRTRIEFRAAALPSGVAKLIELSQAVPEKKDAVRKLEIPPFFQRIGE